MSTNFNTPSSVSHSEERDEELDYSFAGTALCFHAVQEGVNWVIDTGATDHMTSLPDYLHKAKNNDLSYCIKLPNGSKVPITQVGDVKLSNGLILRDILVVPEFKYNLLSVSKMCKDDDCIVVFHDEICLIQDYATRKLRGIGEYRGGLYYFVNKPLHQVSSQVMGAL